MNCNVHAHVMFTYNARFLQGTHESFDVVICSQSLLNLYSMFTYNANEFSMDYMDHSMLFFAHNLCSIHLVCWFIVQFTTRPSTILFTIQNDKRAVN